MICANFVSKKKQKEGIHCIMSENDQQNGTANGDVPEIELIIKVGMDSKHIKYIKSFFSNKFTMYG